MPDPLVHWPGRPEQEAFTALGVVSAARCGETAMARVLTRRRDLLTCPACAQLVDADGEEAKHRG